MKRPRYIPESDDLIAARRAEQAMEQSRADHIFELNDRLKDTCLFHGNSPLIGCVRRGVPEVYSHLYDADSGSSAEVAR